MIYKGNGKYTIMLTHVFIGDDLLVIITGGEKHIGGVSLRASNSFASLTKKDHKDTVISKMVAPIIYDAINKDVLVVCGIHIDNATQEEIDILIKNTQECVDELLKEL